MVQCPRGRTHVACGATGSRRWSVCHRCMMVDWSRQWGWSVRDGSRVVGVWVEWQLATWGHHHIEAAEGTAAHRLSEVARGSRRAEGQQSAMAEGEQWGCAGEVNGLVATGWVVCLACVACSMAVCFGPKNPRLDLVSIP